jgi:uncharacterized protein involved in exopolysaccharide biosynthesis/Mrp family chromosome partitioning ATPase
MATEHSAQLGDYSLLLRRQWWVVVVSVAVATGLAAGYTAVAPPEYTSTTSVLVTPTGIPSDSSTATRDSTSINMDTEAQIITSTEVISQVADSLGHTGDLEELAGRVTIAVPPNTEILDISYAGPTALEAKEGAEAFATAYLLDRAGNAESRVEAEQQTLQARIDDLDARLASVTQAIAALPADSAGRAYNEAQASSLNDQLSELSAQLNELDAFTVDAGDIITEASLPAAPSSPDLLLNLAAGILLGLLAGLGLAVLRQRSDHVIRRASDVERQVGVAVLAEVPPSEDTERIRLVGAASPGGRSYARLRNVVAAGTNREARVVLVAGVSGPAGPVAANLAASLARSGETTILVCGDVDADTESELLGGASGRGLSDVLAGRTAARDALRRLPSLPDLRVLGPGSDRDLANELLQTSGPRTLLADLLETATWVVLEAPATDLGADAQTLARYSDLALLVVQTNGTTAQAIIDARAQFESMRTPVLGAVVVPPQSRERNRDRARPADRDDRRPVPADGGRRPGTPVAAAAGAEG